MAKDPETISEKEQLLLEQPLLEQIEDPEDMFDPKATPPSTWNMSKLFTKIAVPSVLTNMMGFLSVVINAVIVGRMNDPAKMAAVGLANVSQVILILGFMIGLNSA